VKKRKLTFPTFMYFCWNNYGSSKFSCFFFYSTVCYGFILHL